MYTCKQCKKKFNNEPYMSSDNRKYCSFECVPETGIDQPYSYEYFNLMDAIRDIESGIKNIMLLDERIDLESDIEELSIAYTIEIYGDYEGLFYKRQIGIALSILNELYDKVHNIFKESKYSSMPAVIIYWENLKLILGEETATLIFDSFKETIEHFIFENVYFTWRDYKYSILDFYDYEDKLKFATMRDAKKVEKLFLGCLKEYKLGLTEEKVEELAIYSDCIKVTTLYRCVVCGEWEFWERFSFYERLNLYKCNEHCGCFEYDHLYHDE